MELQFLPICGFILPFFVLALCGRLFKSFSPAAGAALALFTAYQLTGFSYSVDFYGWSLCLYLTFITIYVRLLLRKELRLAVILFLVFVLSNFFYYRIEMWMLVTTLAVSITLSLTRKVQRKAGWNVKRSPAMSAAFIVIFLGFNSILYLSFVPDASTIIAGTSVSDFFSKLAYMFTGSGIGVGGYKYTEPASFWSSWLTFGLILTIAIPIFYGVSKDLRRRTGFRSIPLHNMPIASNLKWAILVTGVCDGFVYSAMGVFSIVYLYALFPFVSAISLGQIHPNARHFKHVSRIFFVSLVILSIVLFALGVNLGQYGGKSKYDDVRPGANWLVGSTNATGPVLSDINTYAKFIMLNHSNRIDPTPPMYDTSVYGQVVGNHEYSNELPKLASFVIINEKSADSPLVTINWQVFQPIGWHLQEINSNQNIDKIYDDSMVSILKPL
jgi:hypothetical protein